MATLAFTKLAKGFSYQKDSGVINTFITDYFTVTPDPNTSTEILITAYFPNRTGSVTVSTTDTITANGASVSGTQAQIATALVSALLGGNNITKVETITPLAGAATFTATKDFGADLSQYPV